MVGVALCKGSVLGGRENVLLSVVRCNVGVWMGVFASRSGNQIDKHNRGFCIKEAVVTAAYETGTEVAGM